MVVSHKGWTLMLGRVGEVERVHVAKDNHRYGTEIENLFPHLPTI